MNSCTYYKTQSNQLYGRRNTLEAVPEVFCIKSVPKNFTKFTGKHLCRSLEHLFYRIYPSIPLKPYSMAPLNIVYLNKKNISTTLFCVQNINLTTFPILNSLTQCIRDNLGQSQSN